MTPEKITVALAGNPNSGKTTVFNALTGARQHTGNWPGVTVEKKEGYCSLDTCRITVVDLPGVYSLTAYSLDEVVARDYIVDEQPDVVVDVVDASNLERNLYLTVQILEMQVKMVIALNMMDAAKTRGHEIDIPKLSGLLGVPVVPMVAARGEGVDELLDTIVKVADGTLPSRGTGIHYGQDVENEITALETALTGSISGGSYSPRWLSVKLLENDAEIMKKVKQTDGR